MCAGMDTRDPGDQRWSRRFRGGDHRGEERRETQEGANLSGLYSKCQDLLPLSARFSLPLCGGLSPIFSQAAVGLAEIVNGIFDHNGDGKVSLGEVTHITEALLENVMQVG